MRLRLSSFAMALGVAAVCITATATRADPAINQFEVKDLQSSPGDFEFQSQNAWVTGQPRRKIAVDPDDGELLFDENTVIKQREALEVQLGITDWLRVRVGIEFEQERLDDPASFNDANAFARLIADELAFEAVVVFVKPKAEGVGLGLLVEYGIPISGDPDDQSELYIGPIIEAHSGPWTFIGNFTLVQFIGGKAEPGDDDFVRDEKLDFSYFTQTMYTFSPDWSLALEGYGTIERLGNTGTKSEAAEFFGDFNQHRWGPVAYYTFFPNGRPASSTSSALDDDDAGGERNLSVAVGTGILFGLNENTPDYTYKLSVELEY
jgi:hypothetical protein